MRTQIQRMRRTWRTRPIRRTRRIWRIQQIQRIRRIWWIQRTRPIRRTRRIWWIWRIQRIQWIRRIPYAIFKRVFSFIYSATKVLYLLVSYPPSYTWLKFEPQISIRKE